MITEFFLDSKKYKSKPLKTRILYDIIAYKGNYVFEDKVIHILEKQNPVIDERDKNTKYIINAHKEERETAWECMDRLEIIYESEWQKLTVKDQKILWKIAEEYANIALDIFGWTKGD